MMPIRIWLPFLSFLSLVCGSILAMGMGWHTDYLEMRRRANLNLATTAERSRHVSLLNQTLVSTELPRVSSVLYTLRTQQAIRRRILAKIDVLASGFPNQDAVTAARRTVETELANLTNYQQEVENRCWILAAAKLLWREKHAVLVTDEIQNNGSDK